MSAARRRAQADGIDLTVQWRNGTRTVIACQERQISNGSMLLRTAPGLADVIVPRGLFSVTWLAGQASAR